VEEHLIVGAPVPQRLLQLSRGQTRVAEALELVARQLRHDQRLGALKHLRAPHRLAAVPSASEARHQRRLHNKATDGPTTDQLVHSAVPKVAQLETGYCFYWTICFCLWRCRRFNYDEGFIAIMCAWSELGFDRTPVDKERPICAEQAVEPLEPV
jgi:hypothetical protein